ncbi:MAG: hypothetical protein ACK4WF_10030, partial [Candidatus Brocadiales bacterium]
LRRTGLHRLRMKLRFFQIGSVLLALLGAGSYFLLIGVPWARNTALPSLLILSGAVAWAIYNVRKERSAWTLAPLVLTLLISSGFVYVRFIYASLPRVEVKVALGQPALDFTLPDHQGSLFTLSSLKGKAGAVLVFYRGIW